MNNKAIAKQLLRIASKLIEGGRYPWYGGRAGLNEEQLAFFKQLHAAVPFKMLNKGREKKVHIYGESWDSSFPHGHGTVDELTSMAKASGLFKPMREATLNDKRAQRAQGKRGPTGVQYVKQSRPINVWEAQDGSVTLVRRDDDGYTWFDVGSGQVS